ncbi:hypothetical protein [Chitinophaga arvensicola]|uniref:Uncharacterized protein n=1 Tax=Chitinophaga arvensicola TaxID=29529 RepID=A0A1I0R4Z4_9BACT|nr:hypothetical protein [Chitinophaga arvensicola]SEW35394.1 hypothetical protein SAMN04488122_2235 [Chitinophaga arvensicola]
MGLFITKIVVGKHLFKYERIKKELSVKLTEADIPMFNYLLAAWKDKGVAISIEYLLAGRKKTPDTWQITP